ncbi:hypothetical protein BH23PLA1_BH23PLA1_41710 [soil metagenome]
MSNSLQGPTPEEASDSPSTRREWLPLIVCCAYGVFLSILPHLVWWGHVGGPYWLADNDDLGVYAAIGAYSYHNHPARLGDPLEVSGGETIYSWFQFVPGVLITKALGLGPMDIILVWRVFGGVTIAAGWYLLLRHYFPRPWVVAGLTAFLLGDIGIRTAQPLLKQFVVAAKLVAGQADDLFQWSNPLIHLQWRIISPALIMAYLLVFLWALARALDRRGWPRIALAGLGFGLLFYVYLYYWTAAGLGLLLGVLLDRGRRRVHFHVGWIGGLIGLPSVVLSSLRQREFSPDLFPRIDVLPIDRFAMLVAPKAGLILLVVGLIWTLARRRDLTFLWCQAAAGLLLQNHQLVTGMQMQNFHWSLVWGPLLSLLIVLLITGELAGLRRFPGALRAGLLLLLAVHVGLAIWLRVEEARRTESSREIMEPYRLYRLQRLSPQAQPLPPRAVVAGDPGLVDFAMVHENTRPLDHYVVLVRPGLHDEEGDERRALNQFLLGRDHHEYAAEETRWIEASHWGRWAASRSTPEERRERIDRSIAAFDRVTADLEAALDRYEVDYVALPSDQPPPAYLQEGWSPIQRGPYWNLWRRDSPP